jgi:hypothetical protein
VHGYNIIIVNVAKGKRKAGPWCLGIPLCGVIHKGGKDGKMPWQQPKQISYLNPIALNKCLDAKMAPRVIAALHLKLLHFLTKLLGSSGRR